LIASTASLLKEELLTQKYSTPKIPIIESGHWLVKKTKGLQFRANDEKGDLAADCTDYADFGAPMNRSVRAKIRVIRAIRG
jgi:hypothetical protein